MPSEFLNNLMTNCVTKLLACVRISGVNVRKHTYKLSEKYNIVCTCVVCLGFIPFELTLVILKFTCHVPGTSIQLNWYTASAEGLCQVNF